MEEYYFQFKHKFPIYYFDQLKYLKKLYKSYAIYCVEVYYPNKKLAIWRNKLEIISQYKSKGCYYENNNSLCINFDSISQVNEFLKKCNIYYPELRYTIRVEKDTWK